MSSFWGFHAMFDCSSCNLTAVSSKEAIYQFAKTIVDRIDMIAYGEPIIEYMCDGDPKAGYSLVQLITTSSIVGHFMDSGDAYIDVFSCKEFDIKDAEECVKEFFNPEKMRVNFITRNAG